MHHLFGDWFVRQFESICINVRSKKKNSGLGMSLSNLSDKPNDITALKSFRGSIPNRWRLS